MAELTRVERDPPLLRLELTGGRLNVLTLDLVREMRQRFAEASADGEIAAVILAGGPSAFSAGLDMTTLTQSELAAQELLLEMGELLSEIYTSPRRVVASCAGHAVAAGAMLLLTADIRIGAKGEYRIGFSEVSMGLALPELPVLLARDRLDPRRLQEATSLGRLWTPEEAVELGFLDRLVAPDDLERAVLEAARGLAELDQEAYAGSIASVRGATLQRMNELLDAERKRLSALRSGSA